MRRQVSFLDLVFDGLIVVKDLASSSSGGLCWDQHGLDWIFVYREVGGCMVVYLWDVLGRAHAVLAFWRRGNLTVLALLNAWACSEHLVIVNLTHYGLRTAIALIKLNILDVLALVKKVVAGIINDPHTISQNFIVNLINNIGAKFLNFRARCTFRSCQLLRLVLLSYIRLTFSLKSTEGLSWVAIHLYLWL